MSNFEMLASAILVDAALQDVALLNALKGATVGNTVLRKMVVEIFKINK